jgi:hypothetical protein
MISFFKGLPGPTQAVIVICTTIVFLTMVILVVSNPAALAAISGLLMLFVSVYQILTGKAMKEPPKVETGELAQTNRS